LGKDVNSDMLYGNRQTINGKGNWGNYIF